MNIHTCSSRRASAALCTALAGLGLAPASALASCGAASCNLLNDRFFLGTWEHPGWSLDERVEILDQTQLREGSRRIGPADLPPGEEAIERHTRNRNLVTTLDYSASREWSFALRLPVIHRDHLHDLLDEETGEVTATEAWRFTRWGDAQVLARWQAPATRPDLAWAVTAGLKLPTGSHRVANGDGTQAERALQPGTGTTDVILGISARQVLGLADALNWQCTWTQALDASAGFKPGRKLDVSAGWARALGLEWSVLLQANFSSRGRDSGENAEPDLSGSRQLSLSPGISHSLGHDDTIYALLQVPVYQNMNGIQLVPTSSLALGWTHAF